MRITIELSDEEQRELLDWYAMIETALIAHAIRRGSETQDRMAIKCALALREALIEPKQELSDASIG